MHILFLVKIHSEENSSQFQPHLEKHGFKICLCDVASWSALEWKVWTNPYNNRKVQVVSSGKFYLIFLSGAS